MRLGDNVVYTSDWEHLESMSSDGESCAISCHIGPSCTAIPYGCELGPGMHFRTAGVLVSLRCWHPIRLLQPFLSSILANLVYLRLPIIYVQNRSKYFCD